MCPDSGNGNLARRQVRSGAGMRILVFQHVDVEHPAIFRDFLAEDGVAWDAVELDQGSAIPSLAGYDQLWAMGTTDTIKRAGRSF